MGNGGWLTPLSLVAGSLCAQLFTSLPPPWLICGLALFALPLLISGGTRWLAIALLSCCWVLLHFQFRLADRLGPELAGSILTVSGVISDLPKDRGDYTSFEFRPVDAGSSTPLPGKLLVHWYRDRPALAGTSHLSPHLHFGEISPLQIWKTLTNHAASSTTRGIIPATESYLREIAWREFSHHLLYHYPDTPLQSMDKRFNEFPWRKHYQRDLQRWQRGQTGIPLVDAGMRELWTTGYMHNRVRMITASFLIKNLLIPWQEGAHWFWNTLVDADLANNTMGWQWCAGCGADAAPYFRIFNPVLQGQKFDQQGQYVRRWLPELARLDNKYIHKPWTADPAVLADAGIILGKDYPEPLVDLQDSRRQALSAWNQVRQLQRN